ncbi:MAG: hypothetical protein CMH52_12770 [Myxococcales bacterium]|nr:hypothetical protein [Myxococcales bacterium]
MSKSLKLSLFAALAVMVFTVPAQSARRDGLNGNVLIEDYNDAFTFPQRAGHALNINRVRFNHEGQDRSSATIGVKNGDGGWAIGINALSQPQDPTQERATATMLEAAYSGGAWGIGLSLGKGEFTQDGDGNTALNIGLVAGYTLKNVGEMALALGIAQAENGAGDAFNTMNVGVNLRGYKSLQPKVELGYTAAIQFQSDKTEPDGGDEVENTLMNVELGAGPVYKVGKGIVALHGTVGFTQIKNGDDEASLITIPGMNLAFETPLNDWVEFRAGAGYKFVMTTFSPDAGPEIKINHADADVNQALAGVWAPTPTGAMGLSGLWGNLRIDAAVERDFLTNGPHLLTGTPTAQWASKISATYDW